MNPAMEAEARRAVIACAERLLTVPPSADARESWDEPTRAEILRALRDRTYGIATLETDLSRAATEWTSRHAFAGWLQRFKVR